MRYFISVILGVFLAKSVAFGAKAKSKHSQNANQSIFKFASNPH